MCGTAPSLVEMVVSGRPILSIDIPQNRFTLNNECGFYKDFDELRQILIDTKDLTKFTTSASLQEGYHWENIVRDYEALF